MSVSRAHQLCPVPDRSVPETYPGMELTDEHRARLTIEERFVPGPAGRPDVRVIIYRPNDQRSPLPPLLAIHGGAFVRMRADTFAAMQAGWAMNHDCVVVSVDYRLAPEHPFPAALEDCYAALCWLAGLDHDLDIDRDRLVVTGGSAGGALTAAVCLMARDRGGPKITFQALMIPVLDDRLQTPSMRQAIDAPGFSGRAAEGMWLHYLGEDCDRSRTSPYAAPARAESLARLPPAFIQTNGLDPLRDEGIEYGLRLLAEGIPCEIYNAPGAYHGAPPLNLRAAATANAAYNAALKEALHPSTVRAG